MQYTIDNLRQKIFKPVYDVYEVFQNFFEEPRTDLRDIPSDTMIAEVLASFDISASEDGTYELTVGNIRRIKNYYSTLRPFILVWWSQVTVTNENDRSVNIQDLYAKIALTIEGRIPYENTGFQLTRSTFSKTQYLSGYCHSHVPHFRGLPYWENPCLGTGPIRNTIGDLKNGYEEALWMLFCQELSLYVTVESLRGGPYFRMENIGSDTSLSGYSGYSTGIMEFSNLYPFHRNNPVKKVVFQNLIKSFALHYLQHGHLALSYKQGSFIPGMPYFDFMIDISNGFIDYYNQYGERENVSQLYDKGIIIKVLAADGKFFRRESYSNGEDFRQHEGEHILYFKDRDITLHVEDEANVETQETLLLNHDIAMYILQNILKIINFRYKNEYNSKQLGSNPTEGDTTSTGKTVLYL